MAGPRFSMDLNLGHLITAASIVISVVGTGIVGWNAVQAKLVDHEMRIATLEHTIEKSSDAAQAFQARSYDLLMDMSTRLSRIEGSLGTVDRRTAQH